VPGCGRGHEVALAAELGLDATGLDIAPTGLAEARALYPQFAARHCVAPTAPDSIRGWRTIERR